VKKKKMKKTIAISTAVVAILVLSVGSVAAQPYLPGTLVRSGEEDLSIPTALLPGGFAPISFIDFNGNLVCDIDEPVYVDTGGLGAGVVSVGDIRLTAVGIYAAGTPVSNFDSDIILPLTPLLPIQQNILIVDADSNSRYSVGDWLYLDINGDALVSGSGAGPLGADLRLTEVSITMPPYEFGTKVTTLDDDVDLIPLLILVPGPGPAGWRLDYVDRGSGIYTPGDTVYCKLPLPQHAVPNVLTCDLRITTYP